MRGEILASLENVKIIASLFSEKFKDAEVTFEFDRLERVLGDCKKDQSTQDKDDAYQLLKMYSSATPVREPHDKSPDTGSASKGFK